MMNGSNKYAWTWRIKEEHLAAYVEMHLQPWPKVLVEHSQAGIRNYSIFQQGNQFFYCFECDDTEAAFAYIKKSEVCQRWNAITSKMVEGSFDFNEPDPIVAMREVFFLR
ncbi:L-rhamnose mutarotase [Paenibacillus darwinianus]|nr:L-rhamnose mutarotase [Paenibacillus darwinianus]